MYYHYSTWALPNEDGKSLLDKILVNLVGFERQYADGRAPKTTRVIVDSKTIDNTDTAIEKGYDGGKKLSRIKIHMAVDTNELPHAMLVTTANVSDRDGAIKVFTGLASNLSNVKKALFDGGYTGEAFEGTVKAILGYDVEVEIAKRSELHTFSVIPKRWVVECSFAWLEKCRHLWKNCERKLHSTLQMASLAFVALILRRL